MVGQALNVEIDLQAALAEIDLDSWRRVEHNGWCCMTLKLMLPKLFQHEAPRRCANVSPAVCMLLDEPRIPDKEEKRGFNNNGKPVRMEFAVQAVDHRRLGGHLETINICLIRGIRWAEGALEEGTALGTADILEKLETTLALFPAVSILTELRHRMVRRMPKSKSDADRRWLNASEAYLEVSFPVPSTGLDQWEFQAEARRVIGFTHKTTSLESIRAGFTLVYCLETSEQWNNNLPTACVSQSKGAVSTINMVKGDLNFQEVVEILGSNNVNLRNIARLHFIRPLLMNQQGQWLYPQDSNGRFVVGRTDIINIYWVVVNGVPTQVHGHIPAHALAELCYVDAYGAPRGAHTPCLSECGLAETMAMQSVMVASVMSSDRTVMHKKPELITKTGPGGKTMIGGYPLRNFTPQGRDSTSSSGGSTHDAQTPGRSTGSDIRRGQAESPTQSTMTRLTAHSQQTPRTYAAALHQVTLERFHTAQVLNTDGSVQLSLMTEKKAAAGQQGEGQMTVRGMEAFILAERRNTEALVTQTVMTATAPLREENRRLVDQLASLTKSQQTAATAQAKDAVENRGAIAALKDSQAALNEVNTKVLMAAMQTMIQQNNGNMQTWLMSPDFSSQLSANLERSRAERESGPDGPADDTPPLKK
jgi:hypothetical protein